MNHNPRMVTNTYSKWGVRLGTLALWAAAGASVVFWGLRLSAPAAGPAAPVVLPAPAAPDAQALARLLGAAPEAPGAAPVAPVASLASRFALIGVLSGRSSGGGAALIAVDGKPARPVRVGGAVEDGLVLQSLQGRKAVLGSVRDGTVTLEMAPLASAAPAAPALPR